LIPPFGNNGIVQTDVDGSDDELYGVAIQPDGKILAVGYSFGPALTERFASIVRYNTDGTLDETFGTDGIVLTAFGTSDGYRTLCLAPNDKIMAAGWSGNGTDDDIAIARYNALGHSAWRCKFCFGRKSCSRFPQSNSIN
jgi:uncharacterized delta-60 repeat protein